VAFANAFAAAATTSAANNARGVMSLAFTIPPANAVAMRPAPRKPNTELDFCITPMRILQIKPVEHPIPYPSMGKYQLTLKLIK
jgi:hypothetical protein